MQGLHVGLVNVCVCVLFFLLFWGRLKFFFSVDFVTHSGLRALAKNFNKQNLFDSVAGVRRVEASVGLACAVQRRKRGGFQGGGLESDSMWNTTWLLTC